MNKAAVNILLVCIILCGCLVKPTNLPPTEIPVPLDELVAAALAETQQAEEDNFSPTLPYSPLELAGLLVPGDALEDAWQPSTVYDLTQPYPPLAEWCGEYYNGCAEIFETNLATHGVELELIHEGYQLGEAALLYYEDLSIPDSLFQHIHDNWSDTGENMDPSVNELWMQSFNPFQREDLGQRWMHKVGFSLFEFEGPEADLTYDRPEREFNRVEITFIRCRILVELDLRFPVENPWNSPEDNLEARAAEQEEHFNLIYNYAQAVDERITPYACNP